jgi:peptidoglycan/LPS O-acetylase OafA/YrhL
MAIADAPRTGLWEPPADHEPALDGLRALAILWIVLCHTATAVGTRPVDTSRPWTYVAWSGIFGVDLFFLLSGFLTGRQLFAEHQAVGRLDVAAFWRRRLLRIAPTYYAALALTALAAFVPRFGPMFDSAPPAELLRGAWRDALLLSNYLYSRLMPWSWALAVIAQFYVLAPFLVSGLGRLPPRWRVPALITLALLSELCRVARVLSPLTLTSTAWQLVIYRPFHMRADGLWLGLLCAYLVQMVPGCRQAVRRHAGGWLCAGLALATGWWLWTYAHPHLHTRYIHSFPAWWAPEDATLATLVRALPVQFAVNALLTVAGAALLHALIEFPLRRRPPTPTSNPPRAAAAPAP